MEPQTGKRDEWMRGKFWFVAADGWAANCLPSCGLCDNIASPLLCCRIAHHSFLCLAFCVLGFSAKESPYLFSPQTLRCLWAAAIKPSMFIELYFHVFLTNMSIYSSPRKHGKLYPLCFTPFSKNLLLLLSLTRLFFFSISFSLADGQLPRKTAGQQVKNLFAFSLSCLLFNSASSFPSVCINKKKSAADLGVLGIGQS